jgi:hypothetical protein
MRKQQLIIKFKQPPVITVTLLDSELDELIECVANTADGPRVDLTIWPARQRQSRLQRSGQSVSMPSPTAWIVQETAVVSCRWITAGV